MKRIFVSSTFRDFQEERDTLRNVVLPQMNAHGRKRGEEYSFTDLRWGVNTLNMSEEESNREVLSVCLSEIDRAEPYMIVMLGERYGYRPGADVIKSTLLEHGNGEAEGLFADIDDYDISVTELEILYRLYGYKKDFSNVWFYFRESTEAALSSDDASVQKMEALKRRILELAPEQVRYYRKSPSKEDEKGLSEFAELVLGDMLTGIQEESLYQKEDIQQVRLLQKLEDVTNTRPQRVLKLCNQLIKTESPILLHGPEGCGKSVFMATVAKALGEVGYMILPIFCMSSKEMSDADKIFDYIKDYVIQIRPDAKCLLMIDGIDRLEPSEIRSLLSYLKAFTRWRQLRILISATDTTGLPVEMPSVTMELLQEREVEEVVAQILKRLGKSLSQDVKDALIQVPGDSSSVEKWLNPLRLYMAITELTLMDEKDYQRVQAMGDGMLAIRDIQLEKIAGMPIELEELSVHLLEAVCRAVSPRAWMIACCIALSSEGLRESDLEGILRQYGEELKPLELSRLVNYLPQLFMYRGDGRIDFAHACIRKGLRKKLKEEAGLQEYAAGMLRYFEGLPEEDLLARELWSMRLFANEIKRFNAVLSVSNPAERMEAAKVMMSWLLDFENPKEAGYLEEENLWKQGITQYIGNPACDDEVTFTYKLAKCVGREPSFHEALLEPELRGKVEMLQGALLDSMYNRRNSFIFNSLMEFLTHEFVIAYRMSFYEGRENAKRAVSAIYMKVLQEPFLKEHIAKKTSLKKNYVEMICFVGEILISTGFYKDRDAVLELIKEACPVVKDESDVISVWAYTRLIELEGDVFAIWPEEQRQNMAFARYSLCGNRLANLHRILASANQAAVETIIDEGHYALTMWNINLKMGLMQWQCGERYEASEVFKQLLSFTEYELSCPAQTKEEWRDFEGQKALYLSKLYMALGEDYRCRKGRSPEEAADISREARGYGAKAVEYAKKLMDYRNQNVSTMHQLSEATLAELLILTKVDFNAYLERMESSVYREFNKWHMKTGCRESMLDMIELYELMLRKNQWKGTVAEMPRQQYEGRILALRQRLEYAAPMWNPFV